MAEIGPVETKNGKKPSTCQNDDIVLNIFEKCKYESVHGLQRPLELYQERVLYYTGIPHEALVDKILDEKNVTFQPDLFDRAVINDTLKTLYLERESFSFSDLYEQIKEKVKVPELNSFCNSMRHFGYKPVKTNHGEIILEDPKNTFERYRYLKKITNARNASKTVYYIDERLIDMDKTFKKPWIGCKDMSQIDGYVFFHVVSKNGLEKGLFCNQANPEDFSKWVSDIVLSSIQASSVIIMDNNPLHGKIICEPITSHNSKADMLKWLQRNNIPCSQTMRKADLYDLIARYPVKNRQYELDLIFKSHGHEVLRLPENYHDISVTELLWEHIISSTLTTDVTNVSNLKTKVYNAIASIRQDKWNQFETIIKDTEKNIFAVDEAIEEVLDSYQVQKNDLNG